MVAINQPADSLALLVNKEVSINAPLEVSFAALLEQLGPHGQTPDGSPLPLTLEPWPGGRLFRDLGDGNGHFWGHVQVIKRPVLLEIVGPLFISHPSVSHLQFRLRDEDGQTQLTVSHRAIGMLEPEHLEQTGAGWQSMLDRTRDLAQGG